MKEDELAQLEVLRERARERWEAAHKTAKDAALDFADRAADVVAATVGSWRFILIQSCMIVGWILLNATQGRAPDPYPFILLNLLLSFQAAYTAPIIMMSQNRQADIDRDRSIQDFETNQKAELEIELLHTKIDLLREQEIAQLTRAVESLTRQLSAKSAGA